MSDDTKKLLAGGMYFRDDFGNYRKATAAEVRDVLVNKSGYCSMEMLTHQKFRIRLTPEQRDANRLKRRGE